MILYRIEYRKGLKRPYILINEDTGEIVGRFTSRKDAKASIRARYTGKNLDT